MNEVSGHFPVTDIPITAAGSGVCPECAHSAIVAPKNPSLFRRLLGLRPRPAECPVRVHDVSGLGSLPCMCTHPSHGS